MKQLDRAVIQNLSCFSSLFTETGDERYACFFQVLDCSLHDTRNGLASSSRCQSELLLSVFIFRKKIHFRPSKYQLSLVFTIQLQN
jgi:hypothetical protein